MSDFCMKINSENDLYIAVSNVRVLLRQLSFSDMDKQKVIVSVSELLRNIIDHAGADGHIACEILDGRGIRLVIQDYGKGIGHLNQILNGERPPKRRGLGLGLAGAKRMMDEFEITTSKEGTKIVCVKWKGAING